jgi:hypothetical protein
MRSQTSGFGTPRKSVSGQKLKLPNVLTARPLVTQSGHGSQNAAIVEAVGGRTTLPLFIVRDQTLLF